MRSLCNAGYPNFARNHHKALDVLVFNSVCSRNIVLEKMKAIRTRTIAPPSLLSFVYETLG